MGNMIERTEKCYEGLDMWHLKMDEAYVRVKTIANEQIHFYVKSEDCVECPYKNILRINTNNLYVINTAGKQTWKIFAENQGDLAYDNELASPEICKVEPDVGEFGVYDLHINGSNICEFDISKEPVNIYYPIIVIVLLLIFIYVIAVIGRRIYKKYKRSPSPPLASVVTIEMKTNDDNIGDTAGNNFADGADSVSNMEIDEISPRNRSLALDTFRGIAVLGTVFFRTSNIYSFIEPAKWDGLHLADLCMPWFMFIMGVCIPFSIKSQLDHKRTKYHIFKKILKRSIILYLLGILYYQIRNMEDIRFWGVLQRLAVTYFCVANIYLFVKQYRFEPYSRFTRMCYDIIVLLPQWGFVIGCLMIYELVTLFSNVPDCPRGYVGPGNGHDNFAYRNCAGGAASHIERLVKINLLVILVLIGHTFIGVQCGVIFLTYKKWYERVQRLMIWSIVLGLVGCFLSEFSGWIPINSKLWSLSYMMITCSSAFCMLSICYFLVEKLGYWSGAPFIQAGRNPLFIYIASEFQSGANRLPFILGMQGLETHFLRLVAASWSVIFWTVIAVFMYQRKYFVTI